MCQIYAAGFSHSLLMESEVSDVIKPSCAVKRDSILIKNDFME